MHGTQADHIRPIDQSVLDLLKQYHGLSVQQMTEMLEVTATAVRQRLDRLAEVELVERRKVQAGRGRPQFHYFLTSLGLRYSSVSYADLASALWAEVMELPNPQLRGRIMRRVAKRMGQGLKQAMPVDGSLTERLEAVRDEFGRRKVPATVNELSGLPILEVHTCPYPELTGGNEDRQLCEVEQEMLSEAIGQPVQLDCCRLDGHNVCQFRPVPESSS